MTLRQFFAVMLFSASLWFAAIAFLRAAFTGMWRGPEIREFLALAGTVTALVLLMQWVLSKSRHPVS